MSDLELMLDSLADRIADRVVDRLAAGSVAGWVDQSSSPLGRRRHINAVRTGQLVGVQVGRRYLARSSDVETYIAAGKAAETSTRGDVGKPERRSARGKTDAQRAAELGVELPRAV